LARAGAVAEGVHLACSGVSKTIRIYGQAAVRDLPLCPVNVVSRFVGNDELITLCGEWWDKGRGSWWPDITRRPDSLH